MPFHAFMGPTDGAKQIVIMGFRFSMALPSKFRISSFCVHGYFAPVSFRAAWKERYRYSR